MKIVYTTSLTCPECGARHTETMADDSCQFFHTCASCGALLRPREGDCCVFCSYADAPCPPIQRERLASQASAG